MAMKFALHVHHKGPVIELLTEPIENRISYIRMYKPEGEVEMRLRLLRELTEEEVDQLPPVWREACRAYWEAGRAYWEACRVYNWEAYLAWEAGRAYGEAYRVWVKAGRVYTPDLEALHTRICLPDCPWDGDTIFP